MNRNLDGTPLTHEQHVALAVASGVPEVNTCSVKTGMFSGASALLRFQMWARGELLLDTRPLPRPEPRSLTVDWEFVAAVTRQPATTT